MLVHGHKLKGESHKTKGTECQDWFAYKDNGIAVIAAVADGVGSEKHADFGSKTASETAVSYCAEGIQSGMKTDDILGIIYQSFDKAWRTVEQGAHDHQFDVRQCNTTLSLAVLINGAIYYGHVGDSGIFAFFEDGKIEPVTTQQNDSEGRVFTLSSGPNKWEFDKAFKKVASLLLCTDGIWKMFHPNRLIDEHEKHSVPLLAWYIDPKAIKVHSKYEGFQKWLETDMDKINTNSPNDVNYDDITIVIIHDDRIHHTRQPESYYTPPSKAELEQAKEAEYKRLYGHLEEKKELIKDRPLKEVCEYDKNYSLSIKERTDLAKKIFDEILKENKPTFLDKLLVKKVRYRYPADVVVTKNKSSGELEIRFNKLCYEDNEVYYRIIEQVAKLLTNGLSLSHSKDNRSIAYHFDINKPVFKEELLSKELSDIFQKAYFNYKDKKESSVLPFPNEWVRAIKKYISMLKNCNCKKRGHNVQNSIMDTCPWCVVDEAYSKLKH